MMRRLAPFMIFLAVSFGASAVGAMFLPGAWYAALQKPRLTPPNWVFPVVWPILYACMGVAAALAWRRTRDLRTAAPWAVQLALNAAWSWLFFGLHRPGLAFIELCTLWLAIAVTLLTFRRHSFAAAALMAPYLAWVTFAGWLNWQIWRLNG
jgi:tryptophan-rich sensory protein